MPEYASSLEGELYTLEPYVDDMDVSEYTELVTKNYNCKRERSSPYPTEKSRRRPGRQPARKDDDLNTVERDRLERRRERNRHAAARCRERRMTKITDLEGQVSDLESSKENLLTENDRLQKEVEKMRFQLNAQMSADEEASAEPLVCTDDMFPAIKQLENFPLGTPQTAVLFTPGGTFSLTPFNASTVFNFPLVQTENVGFKNTDSVAEFTKTLSVL